MALRVVIHAPTPAALSRARSNARNLLEAEPDAEVRIVVNADAVAAAVEGPDATTDHLLTLCRNTMERRGLTETRGLAVTPAAVSLIARLQAEGWLYVRA